MVEKEVELVAWLHGDEFDVEDLVVASAKSCFKEESSAKIQREDSLSGNLEETREKIMEATAGKGHGAVLDQAGFTFSIDGLSRASTLFLCSPEYGAHLQQSLRRVSAKGDFPEVDEEGLRIVEKQNGLYQRMIDQGIPKEDARFILPLGTKTAIQTNFNARELMHLDYLSRQERVPEEVRDTVAQMVRLATEKAPKVMKERRGNYEPLAWFPSINLFGNPNTTITDILENQPVSTIEPLGHITFSMSKDAVRKAVEERDLTELANLKQYHFSFVTGMSLATFHQAMRQRTWNHSSQSLEQVAKRGEFVVPEKIRRSTLSRAYETLSMESIDYVANNRDKESVLVLPHSAKIYDIIYINGWNAVHSIGKRTCLEAQSEIRTICNQIAEYIKNNAPELGKYSVPQGKLYGGCPEGKSCGYCK